MLGKRKMEMRDFFYLDAFEDMIGDYNKLWNNIDTIDLLLLDLNGVFNTVYTEDMLAKYLARRGMSSDKISIYKKLIVTVVDHYLASGPILRREEVKYGIIDFLVYNYGFKLDSDDDVLTAIVVQICNRIIMELNYHIRYYVGNIPLLYLADVHRYNVLEETICVGNDVVVNSTGGSYLILKVIRPHHEKIRYVHRNPYS